MLERVIENWLIKSDERGYQIPFCQLLTLKGYKVVHVSVHGPFEQGKDIIALDPNDYPCAFQLKAGDINQSKWRQIRPEIEELIDIRINHPRIDKTVRHNSTLVVSGNLSDPVRREIDDRNAARKEEGKPVLEVILIGELIHEFSSINQRFFPVAIKDIHLFFELYISDGQYPLPKNQLAYFLSIIAPVDSELSRNALVKSAASAVLYVGYLLSPYEHKKNYWSIADGWIIAAAHLMAMAEKFNLYAELKSSIDLSIEAAEIALHSLQEESLTSTDLLEGDLLFESLVYPARVTILISYLCTFRLYLLIKGFSDWNDERILKFINKYVEDIDYHGEGQLVLLINLFWYFKHLNMTNEAKGMLDLLLKIILASQKSGGLPNPYYDIEKIIMNSVRLIKEPIDESFAGKSYVLESLIVLIARHELKDLIESCWRSISHIHCEEFKPKYLWQNFVSTAKEGQNESRFQKQTQSWNELKISAKEINQEDVPNGFKEYPAFPLLLLMVYPQRIRPDFIKFIDNTIANIKHA